MAVLTALRVFTSNLRRSWPLRLEIGGALETFQNEAEFANYLGARTEVQASRIEELAMLNNHAVQRELRHTHRSHQNALDILVRAMETGSRLGPLWGRLDVSKVPDEHDWPSILFSVGNADRVSHGALKQALTHYVHYLEARREILESLGRESQASGRSSGVSQPIVPAAMKDGASVRSFTTRRNKLYARLPRRRAVNLDLGRWPTLTIYLARNRFTLSAAEGRVLLLGQDGSSYVLKPGRNLVGRSVQCDVRLDSGHGDISRQHLLVELSEDNRVRLTDLSSRGTYMPPELLEKVDSITTSRRVH